MNSRNEFLLALREGRQPTMELDVFLGELWEYHMEHYQHYEHYDQEIFRTPIYDFVWIAKGHPDLLLLSGPQALRKINEWKTNHGRSWQEFEDVHIDEDAEAEFLYVWNWIEFPFGVNPLAAAQRKAREKPLFLDVEMFPTANLREFVSFLYWLQVLRREKSIYVPVHEVAKLFGWNAMRVSRYIGIVKHAGLLKKVKDSSRAAGRAAEYFFATDKV